MHMITLEVARIIADAALAEAHKRGIAAAIVVTDMSGDIRVALRSDGAGSFTADIARGKARSALGFNMSTLQLSQFFGASASATASINAATGGRFVALGGGVPVFNAAGQVIGAAAMAGAAPEVDDEVITVGIKAAGLGVAA